MIVLGIDPGTQKAGFAVVDPATDETALRLGVVQLGDLLGRVEGLCREFEITAIALGQGTHAGTVGEMLERVRVPVHFVDEHETTLRARSLYFEDHPPRGWRRLIPRGMQLPPRPVDDYAAVLIARRYLEQLNGD